jgi:hypothetical protein
VAQPGGTRENAGVLPSAADLSTIVDLNRYPIDDLVRAGPVIDAATARLTATGVALLPEFLRAEALQQIVAEADRLAADGNFQDVPGTPYLGFLGFPDESFPPDHPRQYLSRSALTAVAYDLFPDDSLLRALYEWDGLMEFVSAVLGGSRLYRYADPLGALNVATMRATDELGWHFDQTDFVVSIALQSSDEGGEFEAARRVRSCDDECYDAVARVLAGEGSGLIETIPMMPGTLMIFEGRYSLHRVTPIRGDTPRHVALLAYDTKPGTDSTELLKLVRYGRLPA